MKKLPVSVSILHHRENALTATEHPACPDRFIDGPPRSLEFYWKSRCDRSHRFAAGMVFIAVAAEGGQGPATAQLRRRTNMVTLESNRGQSATATPPFERQTPSSEAPAPQRQADEPAPVSLRDPYWCMGLVVAGATIGSMWALGALVLAVLGLSGVLPVYLLPVAGIALGLAFLMLGGIDRVWASMFPFVENETRRDRTIFSSGILAVMAAALAGILVSILNLAYLPGPRFGALAVVVLGLGLFWHSGVMQRVSRFPYHGVEGRRLKGPLAVNALTLAPLRDFFVGAGSVILGFLAILNVAPAALGFVTLLAISGALILTSSTLCSATLATLQGVCCKSPG